MDEFVGVVVLCGSCRKEVILRKQEVNFTFSVEKVQFEGCSQGIPARILLSTSQTECPHCRSVIWVDAVVTDDFKD